MNRCVAGLLADREPIERVFRECFHDDDVYIRLYERWLLPGSMVVSHEIDGSVAGLITFFPVSLVDGETERPAAHSYALGTFEQYRGRGVAKELMLACDREMAALGGAHIGAPDAETLFDYYDRIGYLAKSHLLLVTLPGQMPDGGCELNPCEPEPQTYRALREGFYRARTPFVSYPHCVYEYYLHEVTTDGGELLSVCVDGREVGMLLCSLEEGAVIVRDCLVEDCFVPAALSTVRARYPDAAITVLLPCASAELAQSIGQAREYTVLCGKAFDADRSGCAGTLEHFESCFASLLCHIRLDG